MKALAVVFAIVCYFVFGSAAAFVVGLGFAWLNLWIVELEAREPGIQFGGQLGFVNGLMLGGVCAGAAGGGSFHWIVSTIVIGMVGSFVGGTIVPGLAAFWAGMDPRSR